MFFRNTLKNNIIKNRRLFSSPSSISKLDKELVYGLSVRKYLIGFGLSFVGITGYKYNNAMNKEKNKYKPHTKFLETCLLSLALSPIWPIVVPPLSIIVFFNEITDFAIRKDIEYEIKQKMIENGEKK
jgi:hypothetical protein